MKTVETLGVPELKVMDSNEEYRRDCVLTQPVLIAFGKKCEKIETEAKELAEGNIALYKEYEELRENYIKNVNAKFSEKADLANDLLSQIEE